ncbi:UvrD-helicase domain-containing protein [Halalkalibacter urbisdiaboli]|uniref:UvrD-helicase domain-containing protein n=1 Tax=Halalkalibacter urbisdiaboli TaxID=1960589 RepID=UPI000B435ED0|nr:UvrD-helicase domain-containing protein [Halalkalibacter urbisdiaboli]
MAIMYPENLKDFKYESERFIYFFLKENLPNKFIGYFNYFIEEAETDFCLLVPEIGFIILEVKAWEGHNISRVDSEMTYYLNKNGIEESAYSPLKQCRKYCFKLANKIKESMGIDTFVAPIVCYPNMTENTFQEKSLNIVSERSVTLLKEDFDKPEFFMETLMKKAKLVKRNSSTRIDEKVHHQLRRTFETEEQIIKNPITSYNLFVRDTQKKLYSKLIFIPRHNQINKIQKTIKEALNDWKLGIKIIILTEVGNINTIIYEQLTTNQSFQYLDEYTSFQLYDREKKMLKQRIFHLEIYETILDNPKEDFVIYDGLIEDQKINDVLDYFNDHSNFNLSQYQVEHASIDKHILVSAGAGTGKTHSMISRISFLVAKNHFTPHELLKSIFMITFTNEAANNMKSRLNEYFSNMFIVTENTLFLSYMEVVAKMNISTIHSLVKKIIQYYSVYLGVGTEISIQSGIYERREAVVKELNKLVASNENYLTCTIQYDKYELVKTVVTLLDKLDKKNVDLSINYNFGTVKNHQDLFNLLIETASNVQTNTISKDIEKNTVQLSNLMIYLFKILEQLQNAPSVDHAIKYLFVDEFQDTDDFQIDAIKKFQALFGFRLFVVGDIKQCIYRFRGAEDNAFELLLNGMMNWEKTFSLTKNYRTYDELLQEYHHHFLNLKKLNLLKYDEALQGVEKSGEPIRMNSLTYKTENEFEQRLVETINDLENNGIEKQSIAILTRTNSEIEQIRQICKNYGIEVETDIADNLYKLESTVDLYKLVLALQFNNSPKHLYALSLSNFSKKISNRIVYSHKNKPVYITQLFQENKIIPGWSDYVNRLKNEPVIRVVKQIIYDLKPWNHYIHQFNLKNEEEILQKKKHYKKNMDLLIETIIKRTNDEYMTINKISDFLYIMIFANQHEDERTVEHINKKKLLCTTVHKSKGLEYTHVILPYCESELESISGNEMIVSSKDIGLQLRVGETFIANDIFFKEKQEEMGYKVQEEARILYVAMTRAEKSFTWFKSVNCDPDINKSWRKLLEGAGTPK